MSQIDYEYFINNVFDKTADTYEECFDAGIDYGIIKAKEQYAKSIKQLLTKQEWNKIKQLFE